MNIKTLDVAGIEHAIKAMRNPYNSWHLSDSYHEITEENKELYVIGPKDMILARNLIKGGSEHCKFLRQIKVWANMDMPRYWWSEYDTYKVGTTANSCSTMHKLLNTKEPITLDLFLYHEEDKDIIMPIIKRLEDLRKAYLESKDVRLLVRAKRLLPEGFLQFRTVDLTYANLRNMYHQRKHHRLKEEWVNTFCTWVETLPYAKELITCEQGDL